MKTVNIWGSCVIRDAFATRGPLNETCSVNKFYQNNSIISYSPPLAVSSLSGVTLTYNDFSQTAHCWYNWYLANAEQDIIALLVDNRADFLIMSFIESIYGFYILKNAANTKRLCPSHGINVNAILTKIGLPYQYISIFDMNLNEEIKSVRKTLKLLSHVYSPTNIIYVDFYPAKYYKKDGNTLLFYTADQYCAICSILDSFSKTFQEELPASPYIKLPPGLEADPNHKWGLGSQHFLPETYQKLAALIHNAITKN